MSRIKTHKELPAPVDALTPLIETEAAAVNPPVDPPCALDDAPVHSAIVVVRLEDRRCAVLNTPAGIRSLAADDVAHALPDGAKVQRMGPQWFTAIQLNPTEDHPPFVATTAREAIQRFNQHFHGVRE